tara:strand:- start:252 stop:1127 length:876 start_codon:yes stop_codon:yes gene_type:complete
MSNIFAMVTVKNTNFYTDYAIKSFFKNTALNNDDGFFLIDNDGCETDKFSNFGKIKIIKNNQPLNFAENVNQIIDIAIKNKKNLIFLTNDLVFTKDWVNPIIQNNSSISIPSNNQIFQYQSVCKNLKLKVTMDFKDFNENYELLNDIAHQHKKKFNPNQKFQTLLMPFSCFKIPYDILNQVGYLDKSYGTGGGEDVDYRIRCAIKGHDVNFLIDSYVLHFHGRSTWGIETKKQTEERNKKYTDIFLKKWGKEMTQIFIVRKDFINILEKKNVKHLFEKGKFGDLIREIYKK